jgi:NAD(P)-dependent dehydrogenase (short-subunit alcohol dehydrogenase family)
MRISDAVFVVTGGSSGLGEATVRTLYSRGASVVIADIASEKGESLATSLVDRTVFVRTDVTSESDALQTIQMAKRKFGKLDGLVNCAGIGPAERILGKQGPHRLDSFARCVNINLIGTFNMVRLAAAAMAEGSPSESGERGIIINTASVAGYEGQIGQAAYAASKAGIIGMTLPMARELARHGIRVMTIAPGLFLTPMMAALPKDVQEALGNSTPFPPRLGRAEEFAALVTHIIENEMLNGETIRLDGAVRLAAK